MTQALIGTSSAALGSLDWLRAHLPPECDAALLSKLDLDPAPNAALLEAALEDARPLEGQLANLFDAGVP